MKLTKITIFLSTFLLLAGCTKTDNANNTNVKVITKNTTNAAATPKAIAEAAASPSATTTTQSKVAKPEDAANGLLNAWKTKDRTEAAKFATEAAYTKLFKEGGGPEGMESQGCSDEKGVYNCGYTYPGGALIMIINGNGSAGYRVDSIEFIAD